MSKKFKSQASSARAATAGFGGSAGFGSGSTSLLSYIAEQPDLSSISDPNLVVCLRNLGKKDSVTKAKALEELQSSSLTDLEDSFLSAWTDLYPRTSIDNSRRVRQLAHQLQGSITSSAGKRIAPLLPKIIGAWICGLYDSDKGVSKTTQDSLVHAFSTPEKREALWKVYADALLDHAEDAILLQTSSTLSDERSTSQDDAKAKKARVSGSGMAMLVYFIRLHAQPSTLHTKASHILGDKRLWEFVYDDDPYLRRSVSTLATQSAKSFKEDLDWQALSTCFLAKGLNTVQLGSIGSFSEALLTLSQVNKSIWTTEYRSKTTVTKRLLQYLRRGSQRGPEIYWKSTNALLKLVLPDVLGADETIVIAETCSSVIEALFDGLTHQDEPRQNLTTAWACYVDICFWVRDLLPNPDQQHVELLKLHVLPLVARAVEQEPAASPRIPQAAAVQIVQRLAAAQYDELLTALLSGLYDRLIELMKLSQPHSSKDHNASQNQVLSYSQRMFGLTSTLRRNESDELISSLHQGDERLLEAALNLVRNRQGHPFGAAAVLVDVVSTNTDLKKNLVLLEFLEEDLTSLLQSPSADRLIQLSQLCNLDMDRYFLAMIETQDRPPAAAKALNTLLQFISTEVIESHAQQVADLLFSSSQTPEGQAPEAVTTLLKNNRLGSKALTDVVQILLRGLSKDAAASEQAKSLQVFKDLAADKAAKSSLADNLRNDIVSRLLILADVADQETADSSNAIMKQLQATDANASGSSATRSIIEEQLSGVPQQLSILSLVALAHNEASSQNSSEGLTKLLPSEEDWKKALRPHLTRSRPASLAITSPLQGAMSELRHNNENSPIFRDAEGFSMAFRLAIYVSMLMSDSDNFASLDSESLLATFKFFPLALQLVNEKVTLETLNEMWIDSTLEVVNEALETMSRGSALIYQWIPDDAFFQIWLGDTSKLQGNDTNTYISCLAFCDIAARAVDRQIDLPDHLQADIKELHRSEHILYSASLAYCMQERILLSDRTLNELVDKSTIRSGQEIDDSHVRGIILLNVLLSSNPDPLERIPSQRVVFLMQGLVRSFLQIHHEHSYFRIAEISKLLCSVLPSVQEIYGEHWEQLLEAMQQTLQLINAESASDLTALLPALHGCFKLLQKLSILGASEEANEDLQEAWKSSKPQIDALLLDSLLLFEKPGEGVDQPRLITISLLERILLRAEVKDTKLLLPLMGSSDKYVLRIAFHLLHTAIPQQQQDLSLALALENQIIRLPEEILQFISTPADLHDQTELRRYLLSWRLIFDHFENASYKLQEMYLNDLKTDITRIASLLDQICDIIRITDSRPINASKFLERLTMDHPDPTHETQWLAIHLYQSCLLLAPSPSKSWFIEQKNRIKSPLETWTQKYISPTIISAALTTATTWATDTQDQTDNPILLKSSPRSFELVASMEIDAESPPIAITILLPPTYPLSSPSVLSRTRVGVSEKTWQSWLNTIKIIIFSTGSIIEGLVAFRRNVQGALKGQGECAICYSIIGADMQTPNKRCGTCRNMFHGGCLFRWFKSSNSSTCPLCRNSFSYA